MGMKLTDTQKQQVAAWIEQGLKLSEVQNKLAAEFDARLTYMEVRFLIDDLKLKPKDPEPPKPPPAPAPPAAPAAELDDELDELVPEAAPPASGSGNVKVSVDQVTRPGAMVSGKVTFSDGQTAEWYLDQLGRLAVAPKTPGYRPPQSDVMLFQTQLQAALASARF